MLHAVTTGAYYPPVDTTWKILTTRSSYVVDSGSIVQWCRSGSFLNVGGHSSPLISLLSRLFSWQTGFPSDQSCHLLAILNEIAPNLLAPWTHCSKMTSDFGSQDLLDPQTGAGRQVEYVDLVELDLQSAGPCPDHRRRLHDGEAEIITQSGIEEGKPHHADDPAATTHY